MPSTRTEPGASRRRTDEYLAQFPRTRRPKRCCPEWCQARHDHQQYDLRHHAHLGDPDTHRHQRVILQRDDETKTIIGTAVLHLCIDGPVTLGGHGVAAVLAEARALGAGLLEAAELLDTAT